VEIIDTAKNRLMFTSIHKSKVLQILVISLSHNLVRG